MLGSAERRTESSRLHVLMKGPQNSHLQPAGGIHQLLQPIPTVVKSKRLNHYTIQTLSVFGLLGTKYKLFTYTIKSWDNSQVLAN